MLWKGSAEMNKCPQNCGEVIARGEDYLSDQWFEVDTKNLNRVTSVMHTPKRCRELVTCRKGNKPRPVSESVMDQFF
jgi:hypothetical protein